MPMLLVADGVKIVAMAGELISQPMMSTVYTLVAVVEVTAGVV